MGSGLRKSNSACRLPIPSGTYTEYLALVAEEKEEEEAIRQLELEEKAEAARLDKRRESTAATTSNGMGAGASGPSATAAANGKAAAAAAAAPKRSISYYEVSGERCTHRGREVCATTSAQGVEYKKICKEMEQLNVKKDKLDAAVMALAQVNGRECVHFGAALAASPSFSA